MDIGDFLKQLDLERYLPAFIENEVDIKALPHLDEEDLKELGLPLGPRRRLQNAVKDLQSGEPHSPDTPDEPVAERRQVTILFADLSRFSQISSQLGAEDTHILLNRYFETVDEIVENYGGTIDKHIGDCVMAVFGAPVAHSNDPERAVRAAHDIHLALAKTGKVFDQHIAAHIGIASGQVVASGVGSSRHRTYTITGESVNLASRLSDLGHAGETLVSEGVKLAAQRFASFTSKGELLIKGFDGAIAVWELSGLRTTPREQEQRALVGRTRECGQFSGLVEQVTKSRLGQTVVIRGDAGIGKTRLIEEFASIAGEHDFACRKAHVLDFGVGKGQDAIRTLVAGVTGLDSAASKAERHALLERLLGEKTIAQEQIVYLLDLLNLPLMGDHQSTYHAMDNATRNKGKRQVCTQLIRFHAQSQALLLLIEDIHWCDQLTLDSLSAIASGINELPVIVLLTSRPEGAVMDQHWMTTLAPCPLTTMELLPLGKKEALALARAVTKQNVEVLDELVARADGNPLFIEQLAQGGIEIVGDELPDTLQGLVLARTDRLDTRDAFALKAASVIGTRYSIDLLRHLIDDPDYDCTALLNHRLVRLEDGEYLFGHALIRDGVYASLLRADRQRLHLAAASWFAEHDPFLHAQHLHRADDEGAASAYQGAAQAFQRQHQLERAVEAARLGCETAVDTNDKCTLQLFLGELLRDASRLPAAAESYQSALDIASNPRQACRARIGLAAVMRVTDQIEQAWSHLDEAQQFADAEDMNLELAEIHELRGNLCFPLGKVEQCLEEHRLGLAFARKAASPQAEAQSLGGLGDACYAAGMMKSANGHYIECLALTQKHGLDRIKIANLSSLAATRKYLLDLPTAIDECREAAIVSEKIGAKRSQINALHSEIELLIERMELDLGDQKINEAIKLIEDLGARRFMARALHYRGRMLGLQGARDMARDHFRQALEISLSTGSGYVGPTTASSLALACTDPGERARHLATGLELLEKGAVAHNVAEYYRDAIEIALIEERWDDVPGLASRLRGFSRELLPWIDFWASRGECLALVGAGSADKDTHAQIAELHTIAANAGIRTALAALEKVKPELAT